MVYRIESPRHSTHVQYRLYTQKIARNPKKNETGHDPYDMDFGKRRISSEANKRRVSNARTAP